MVIIWHTLSQQMGMPTAATNLMTVINNRHKNTFRKCFSPEFLHDCSWNKVARSGTVVSNTTSAKWKQLDPHYWAGKLWPASSTTVVNFDHFFLQQKQYVVWCLGRLQKSLSCLQHLQLYFVTWRFLHQSTDPNQFSISKILIDVDWYMEVKCL